jgi:Arc/MetJ-type ribon-helix-helix transcriptional regulator
MAEGSETNDLPEDLRAFAEERVKEGEYESIRHVTRAAFDLLMRRHEDVAAEAESEASAATTPEDLGEVFREMEEAITVDLPDDANEADDAEPVEPTDDEVVEAAPPTEVRR